jgi:hypothetical protein
MSSVLIARRRSQCRGITDSFTIGDGTAPIQRSIRKDEEHNDINLATSAATPAWLSLAILYGSSVLAFLYA